ncbi:MAG: hypothetical protein IPL43_10800 [Micropruina sp.]|nr:hypothetical protein [Micropruina sp.]
MTTRALVLGSGGLTGAAWLAGMLAGIAESGVDVRTADRIIGTSAGALVGARLAAGESTAELDQWARTTVPPAATLPGVALARLLAAQVAPSRQQAVRWLGRVSGAAAAMPQEQWRAYLDAALSGIEAWPERLSVVCVACDTGLPQVFTRDADVPLPLAVAASCAMPGIFPR